MIELKNITKIYNTNGNTAIGLNDVSLTLPDVGFVFITGPSGSGKTTLLNVISCIDSYEEGEMIIDGMKTSSMTLDEIEKYRRSNVGFVYQNYNLIDSYTVLQNVLLPLEINGVDHKEAVSEAKRLIDLVGLTNRIKHKATKLSGGEKQRCVIARALASKARIIACDEPTGNLDRNTSNEIVEILHKLSKDHLVLMVTHNTELMENKATRIIRVFDGQISSDNIINTTTKDMSEKRVLNGAPFPVLLKTAIRNVFQTPKRTILSILILTVLFTIIAVCYSTAIMGYSENIYYSHYYNNYNLSNKNRNIVSNKESNLNDISTKGDIIYNDFFYDNVYMFVYYDQNIQLQISYDKSIMDNLKPGEVVLEIGKSYFEIMDKNEVIKSSIKLNGSNGDFYKSFTVKDVEKSDLNNNFVYMNKSDLDIMSKLYISKNAYRIFDDLNISSDLLHIKSLFIDEKFGNQTSGDIYLPQSFKNKSGALYIGKEEVDLDNYDVIYHNSLNINITESGLMKLCNDYKLRASIFYNSLNESKSDFKALKADYDIINASYTSSRQVNLGYIFEYMFLCFFYFVACLVIFVVTKSILNIVMKSKNKDYNIFRTLGLLKKELKVISILELEITALLSMVLVFIILFSLTNVDGVGSYISQMLSSIYLPVILILISILIMLRLGLNFNRKIFNLTISQSLRAGDFID